MKNYLKIFGIIALIAVIGFAVACEGATGPMGPEGPEGPQGPGGDAIVWKGTLSAAPANPQLNWAYYNTTDGKTYIYAYNTATPPVLTWQVMVQDGVIGATGAPGSSIVWKGELAAAPSPAELNWAYYNTADKKAYIYNGTVWQILAKDGEDVPPYEITLVIEPPTQLVYSYGWQFWDWGLQILGFHLDGIFIPVDPSQPNYTLEMNGSPLQNGDRLIDIGEHTVYVIHQSGKKGAFEIEVEDISNSDKEILSFSFDEFDPPAMGNIIWESPKYIIYVEVPHYADIENLTPTIVFRGAEISPELGVPQDFSSTVNYTVTARDGYTMEYSVIITVLPSYENDITAFSFEGLTPTAVGVIDSEAKTVTVTVPYGTNRSNLTPTIEISDAATISPASGAPRNFNNPVTYDLWAEDSTYAQWTVTVKYNPLIFSVSASGNATTTSTFMTIYFKDNDTPTTVSNLALSEIEIIPDTGNAWVIGTPYTVSSPNGWRFNVGVAAGGDVYVKINKTDISIVPERVPVFKAPDKYEGLEVDIKNVQLYFRNGDMAGIINGNIESINSMEENPINIDTFFGSNTYTAVTDNGRLTLKFDEVDDYPLIDVALFASDYNITITPEVPGDVYMAVIGSFVLEVNSENYYLSLRTSDGKEVTLVYVDQNVKFNGGGTGSEGDEVYFDNVDLTKGWNLIVADQNGNAQNMYKYEGSVSNLQWIADFYNP